VRAAAALLAGALLAGIAAAEDAAERERAAGISLGPRLLDYPVECVDPRGCRIECFQDGVKVLSRGQIALQDELRLIASTSTRDEITPRWIEIRPFSGNDVQTLLLSAGTVCDLRSLVISPKPGR